MFEVLYSRFARPPSKICMDNACNLHSFILNREPAHFYRTEMYIDEAHFRGHKRCCPAYNTGECPCHPLQLLMQEDCGCLKPCTLTCMCMTGLYPEMDNSPLAEQKNSILRRLESSVSYMKQTTFMYYMRYVLYRVNKVQAQKNAETCFWQG